MPKLTAPGTIVAETYPPNALDPESRSRIPGLGMVWRGSPGIMFEQHIPQLLRCRSAQRREIRVNLVAFLLKKRVVAEWQIQVILGRGGSFKS